MARPRARSAERLGERAVAVAQEHRDVVDDRLGDGQVEVSVAGEVARHDRVRGRTDSWDRASQRDRLARAWNVPSPLPRRMVTGARCTRSATARSMLPVAGEVARDDAHTGRPATGIGGRLWNVPSPLPRRMETSSRLGSATARSVRPSPLKSAATIDVAPLPGGKATVKGCWNVPSPLPGRMVTLSEPWLTTARPRLPLPVKSPVATAAVSIADRRWRPVPRRCRRPCPGARRCRWSRRFPWPGRGGRRR